MRILLELFLTFTKIGLFTFVGFRQAGSIGSLIATFGMILPSFLIMYTISMFLDNFLEIAIIANAFKEIKITVGILILDAASTMIGKIHKKVLSRVIVICSFAAMLLSSIFAWNFL